MVVMPYQGPGYADAVGDAGVLWLAGEWDIANEEMLPGLLTQLRSSATRDLVVDVSGVRFIGVQVMLMLVGLASGLRAEGRTLALRGATTALKRQLRLLLTCAVPLHPSTLLFLSGVEG